VQPELPQITEKETRRAKGLATVEEAIEEYRNGRSVIIIDDEDRENEGDLTIPAQFATPEAINFMARYARGLICVPMTGERLEQLHVPMMVSHNDSHFGTPFSISVEARAGVTTGISAADRAHTIQVLIDPKARPNDLVMPGHIFPLRARDGGVHRGRRVGAQLGHQIEGDRQHGVRALPHVDTIAAVRQDTQLGAANGFAVDATEDASAFTSANLSRYVEAG